MKQQNQTWLHGTHEAWITEEFGTQLNQADGSSLDIIFHRE